MNDGMMDGSMVVVVVGIVLLLLLMAVLSRPGAPDPENPEEAPQALGEGMTGMAALLLVVVGIFVGVLAL